MSILQLANGYLGSKLYSNLFDQLKKQDVDNEVYVPVKKGTTFSNVANPKVVISPCFNDIDRLMYFSKQHKIYADIKNKIDLSKIDITHAHTLFSSGYIAYLLKKRLGIPYIVAVRNTDKNVFFKYMVHLRHLGVKILNNASKIIFLSPQYKNQVIKQYIPKKYIEDINAKSLVVPNGIDSLFFCEPVRDKTMESDNINLVYIGEISTNKNLETIVDAVKLLNTKGYNLTLKVIGEILEDKYKKIISDNTFIIYYEKAKLEQVKKFLQTSDIFVMPSHHETFGLVYIEAMSQGLPIIYTKNEGIDGYFENGEVGFAVNSKSPKQVAESILAIKENYNNMSNNCVHEAAAFSWDSIAHTYKELYQKIKNKEG